MKTKPNYSDRTFIKERLAMKFICLCEEEFEVEGVNTILPKHKKQTGELCPASKKSVKKACLIEPAPDCPLTMGHAYCAFCHTRPCLAEKKGVWP